MLIVGTLLAIATAVFLPPQEENTLTEESLGLPVDIVMMDADEAYMAYHTVHHATGVTIPAMEHLNPGNVMGLS